MVWEFAWHKHGNVGLGCKVLLEKPAKPKQHKQIKIANEQPTTT